MTGRLGWRRDKGRPPDSSSESVSASGQGAAAVGGDVPGIVSTGPNAANVQVQNLFVRVDAPGSLATVADEDRLSRGPVAVGDVPQQPPAFQLRTDLVALIGERGAGVCVVHAVTGMRGVGKTQIAAAYARGCLAAGWRLVAWVDAGDTASVLAGLGVVAAGLGLSTDGADAAGVAEMVRHWLEADGHDCLVVFDNAVDIDGLRPFLPAAGEAQIVITSSRQAAGNLGVAIPVDVFTKTEAGAFLAARTGLDDGAGAQELAEEMGWLPLGLAQAAAVIAQQRLGYDTYLKRLRAIRLDQYLERVEGDPYPHRVAEAVVLSLEAAEAADPSGTGRGIMDLIALLSAAGVSRAILHSAAAIGVMSAAAQLGRSSQGRGSEIDAMSAADADAAIGQLADWSLLMYNVDGSVISAHRLIMRVVRELRMADGSYTDIAELAAALLANLSDEVGVLVWERPAAAAELVAQITALHEHTTGRLDDSAAAAETIRYLRVRAVWLVNTMADRPSVAINISLPLVAEFERVLGADHPNTLMARNNLAMAYQAAGRLNEAISLFERTLADRDRVLGADHPMSLTSRNNLAGAYRDAGRFDEAIALYGTALAGRERVLGSDNPDTMATRSNLAVTFQDAGRQDEAIPLLERTLADSERTLGVADPRTLTLRNNLAGTYFVTGQLDEAASLLASVLADRESVLGEDHPETLVSRINLAGAYQAAGKLDEAITLFERTFADSERALGADNPNTLISLMNLAVAYQEAERLDKAIPMFERLLVDSERVIGPDHPGILNVLIYLAGAYQAAGRLTEAIPLFERALADGERLLSDDHPNTLTSRKNLADAYLRAERPHDSIVQGERLVTDNQRILGTDHPETMKSRNNLAVAYGAANQLDQAVALLESTIADIDRVLGPDDPETTQPRINLASAYLEAGQPSKAIPLLEEILASSDRLLGADHPNTLSSRYNLAIAYWRAGQLGEAIPLFERTAADSQRVLGADHSLTRAARDSANEATASMSRERQDDDL